MRSFSWGPPCEAPAGHALSQSANSRRGFSLLSATNDAAELIILCIKSPRLIMGEKSDQRVEILYDGPLPQSNRAPLTQPNTLLSKSLQFPSRIYHMSWSPWQYKSPTSTDLWESKSFLALLYGSTVQIYEVCLTLDLSLDNSLALKLQVEKNDLLSHQDKLQNIRCKGPLHWIYQVIITLFLLFIRAVTNANRMEPARLASLLVPWGGLL